MNSSRQRPAVLAAGPNKHLLIERLHRPAPPHLLEEHLCLHHEARTTFTRDRGRGGFIAHILRIHPSYIPPAFPSPGQSRIYNCADRPRS